MSPTPPARSRDLTLPLFFTSLLLGCVGVITPIFLALADHLTRTWLYLGGAIGLLGLFLAMLLIGRACFGPLGVLAIFLNIFTLIFALSAATISPTRPLPARTLCEMNMRYVGMSLMIYAADHHGTYPPDLDTIHADQLIRPTSTHCTYLYNPPTDPPQPDTILLYEPLHDHPAGINILFADMRVEFRSHAEARALLTMQNLKPVQ